MKKAFFVVVLVLCVAAGVYYWFYFNNGVNQTVILDSGENGEMLNSSESDVSGGDESGSYSVDSALNDEQRILEDENTRRLVQGCLDGKDCIPSIDDPKFVPASAASVFLSDDDLVVGVNIGDESKAYPIKILNWHEVVNDEIGDKNVAITFCPLCFTGIVYERMIGDEPVEFGVSGYLLNSNLVMYDKKTDALWSQLTGEALTGAQIGKELNKITAWTVQFGVWKQDHPDTLVLSTDTGFERDYDLYPYGEYRESKEIYFALENSDNRLFEKELIIGVTVADKSKAYPVSVLKEQFPEGGEFEDSVGGHPVFIKWDKEMLTAVDTVRNVDLTPVTAYWFAWAAFYPETEIYGR